jgi:protein-S-isoprenylcysteine O-methyltransferase Ste14
MTRNSTSDSTALKQLVFSIFYLLIFVFIPLYLSGDTRWMEGWIFSSVFFLGSLGTVIYLYLKDPALLNERFGSPVQKQQKSWDKGLLVIFFLSFTFWYAIMPLDARRYGWSGEFPIWLKIVGFVLFVAGFYFLFGAMRENTFAAPVVKMQKERGQKVISTGLYGIVRHPMYAGGTLLFLGGPLLLGSIYGLAVGVLLTVMLAVRILGEEQMLKQELEGYTQYMTKVRWRMIPFVY